MFDIAIAALCAFMLGWYIYDAKTTDERIAYILGTWLGVGMTFMLIVGVVKIAYEGERDYRKEAKTLIAECEQALPRDQNCVIEMKATVR